MPRGVPDPLTKCSLHPQRKKKRPRLAERKKHHCRRRSAANATVTAAFSSLQESTARLVRTTWTNRRSHCSGWPSRCFFGNAWNPPCRSCLFASATSPEFYNSVTSATRPGLVFSTSVPRFLEAGGSLHQPINPIYGKISGQNVTVRNAKAYCCFQTAKWTTELQTWAHQLHCRYSFHFKSSDRAVACNVAIDVISSSFSETRHPSGHDIPARGRRRCHLPRLLRPSRKTIRGQRLFRTDANDFRRSESNRPLPTSTLRFRKKRSRK